MTDIRTRLNPKTDLIMERTVDVPREIVWKAWTEAEHLKKWFCPKPWQTTEAIIDLRPGGRFYTAMKGPEGESHSGEGCYLEVTKHERLIWTSGLAADFRPITEFKEGCGAWPFTAHIIFEPNGKNGTKYTVVILHSAEEHRRVHEEMGFPGGWDEALKQLVELYQAGQL